jgi:hypothetical protein
MDHPLPTSRLVNVSHCSHLRHKGMYVLTTPDPGESDPTSYSGATAYWCTCTMKGLGPDGQPVSADRCLVGSGRGCCVE